MTDGKVHLSHASGSQWKGLQESSQEQSTTCWQEHPSGSIKQQRADGSQIPPKKRLSTNIFNLEMDYIVSFEVKTSAGSGSGHLQQNTSTIWCNACDTRTR